MRINFTDIQRREPHLGHVFESSAVLRSHIDHRAIGAIELSSVIPVVR